MKQFWHKLMNKLWHSVLNIACLYEMGMSPREAHTFLGIVDPDNEEARYMVGVARLKNMDEITHIQNMVDGMLNTHGWLLIGVAFTAVIHMLGSSVLFIKSFQCEKGLFVYGGIVSVLTVLALATAVWARREWVGVLLTAVLMLLSLSQLIVLKLPQRTWRHRQVWLASNSSIVALLSFILAQQVAMLTK